MKTNKPKQKSVLVSTIEPGIRPSKSATQAEVPEPEAFLEEAKREPKQKLILDHIRTIRVLRDEKKFTFRAIADFFNKRGFATDHSAVYRAFLLSIKPEEIHPDDDEFREELKQMQPD